jgi:hypothetical protein
MRTRKSAARKPVPAHEDVDVARARRRAIAKLIRRRRRMKLVARRIRAAMVRRARVEFLNLHEILIDSAIDASGRPFMKESFATSFALERDDAEWLKGTTKLHGSTPTAFLRTCVKTLRREMGEL